MKKLLLVLFLLTQMILNITHACDIQDSSSNQSITSFSDLSAITLDSHDCNNTSDRSNGNRCDACLHCVTCLLFTVSRADQISFNLTQLLVFNFYYSNQNYQSFINLELRPPIYLV